MRNDPGAQVQVTQGTIIYLIFVPESQRQPDVAQMQMQGSQRTPDVARLLMQAFTTLILRLDH